MKIDNCYGLCNLHDAIIAKMTRNHICSDVDSSGGAQTWLSVEFKQGAVQWIVDIVLVSERKTQG